MPNEPLIALGRALLAFQAGDLAGAVEHCQAALAGHPHMPRALLLLAIVQAGLGQGEAALQALRRALATLPARQELAEALRRLGQLPAACAPEASAPLRAALQEALARRSPAL